MWLPNILTTLCTYLNCGPSRKPIISTKCLEPSLLQDLSSSNCGTRFETAVSTSSQLQDFIEVLAKGRNAATGIVN